MQDVKEEGVREERKQNYVGLKGVGFEGEGEKKERKNPYKKD